MDDYFAVFGLPRTLRLDAEELRRRFHELSRAHHPDFHQGATEEEQAHALSTSALVNRAYRVLRDPVSRLEYLIALEEGRELREATEERPRAPRELLEEMMDVQEALQAAAAGGLDAPARQRLGEERLRLTARREAEEEAIAARAADWDAVVDGRGDRDALLAWFKQRLAARAYLRTVIDDLSDALGEGGAGEEAHVSHRRH